jgi:hypothetical protein
MTTFEFPVFVSFTSCVVVVPTRTFPKLKFVALAESFIDDATPVPVNLIVIGAALASLVMETLPESAPAAVGLNAIVKFILEPAAIVAGAVSPDILKPAPEMVVLEIARSAVPVFDTFIGWVDSVLTVTLPKLAEEGVTLIAGVPEPGLPPPVPLLPVTPQPTRPGPEIIKTARKAISRIDRGEPTLALSCTRTLNPPGT